MRHLTKLLAICGFILHVNFSFCQIQITLRQSFIDSIKNRVTIHVDYIIDKAHAHPNPPSKDGDMHIAGRAEIVGLPIVAEIMNAASQTNAVNKVHSVEGSDQTTDLTGVWRLWCEHAGNDEQIQGETLTRFTTTNPAHVFEIHPITKINNNNLLTSLKPINGFTYKKAEDALMRYAGTRCQIVPENNNAVIIQTNGVGFNYVECKVEIAGDPFIVDDGRFIFCKILTTDDEIVAQNVRVAFVKDSKPEKKTKTMHAGDVMRIIAIPRIDLALVSFRINHAEDPKFPNILSWNLPFELVAVAVKDQ
jgi:hypothetical protein